MSDNMLPDKQIRLWGGVMNKGTIFNIQKFSVHDGPGIRTTVFFKGCPLRCKWCHNPEGQCLEQELVIFDSRCLGCGMCIPVCPNRALEPVFTLSTDNKQSDTQIADETADKAANAARVITIDTVGETKSGDAVHATDTKDTRGAEDRPGAVSPIVTDRQKCTVCGKCAEICPAAAREMAGKKVTSDWVINEILKDRIFYEQSGGGVTFSGGEPLMQPQFLCDLLLRCKDEGINTAVDTSGYAPFKVVEQVASLADIFLYDVKIMDPGKHAKYTGVSNELVLDNLSRLSQIHQLIIARMPIIPGMNDGEQNIRDTGKFLSKLNIRQINILPYHNIGSDKYTRLGKAYCLKDVSQPDTEDMSKVKKQLEEFGLTVKIGG